MHHCLSVLSIIVSTDPSGAVGEQCEGLMPIYDPRADGPICTYGSPFAQICQFRFFRHRKKRIKQLTLGRMISKDPVIRFVPETAVNTFLDRDLWSGALGSYGMAQKEPYVNLDTRVLTKWSR